jgi:hypothetical protein
MDTRVKKALIIGSLIAGGLVLYKLIRHKETPKEAIKQTISEVKEIPSKIAGAVEGKKKGNKLVKGSPEAKAFMASMREKRNKSKSENPKPKGHKGHETKRGLAQDQKLRSKEDWEKEYQKNKK